ncbi:hypothetical protein [Coleofasciculus sp. FACHB-1120]|uniref:hypothetical protein n=1 Tax=Coleofasciculus sp. FACHB-1120 TaxID=2692783 RepID=UPI0016854226|nr:hypothetical protein [Coleofasciculus sp. FACHB-1120]MBD2744102.1 hypothetical protein [Coleofasciculus sp. FACHB-1120]
MAQQYKYLKIQKGLYLGLEQNFVFLVWLIYLKGKPLSYENSFFNLKGKNLRETVIITMRFLYLQLRFIKNQLVSPSKDLILELPFPGNFCFEVNNGYKIFDLSKEIVIKKFKSKVDPAIVEREIERSRQIGLYDFAPSVQRWSLEEQWYEESYVNGCPIRTSAANFFKSYYQYVAPCIESMIVLQGSETMNLLDYVDNLVEPVTRYFSNYKRDAIKINIVNNFLNSIISELDTYRDFQVHLVMSHGDFKDIHVLEVKQGIKIIDWEFFANRSVLFDFYHYCLAPLFFGSKLDNLAPEMNKAMLSLQSSLTGKAPDIADSLIPSAQVYRKLFYLERLCSLPEVRGVNLDTLLRWINVFNEYENMLLQ